MTTLGIIVGAFLIGLSIDSAGKKIAEALQNQKVKIEIVNTDESTIEVVYNSKGSSTANLDQH